MLEKLLSDEMIRARESGWPSDHLNDLAMLADEGTTYGEIVDHLRRSLALQYLEEPGLSLSQIAWLLGYEESTSFNHAFKRWTGRSPSDARNQKQLPAPG
jgi:AraC-like DNA-binding protein